MGYHLLEVDGVEADDTKQLLTWIRHARDAAPIGGRGAVLLDDFESFTDEARRAVAKLLRDGGGCTPVVITCTQFKEPRLRDLREFEHIRLFAPFEHTLKEWVEQHGFSLWVNDAGELREVHRRPPLLWERRQGVALATRDLRRVHVSLSWTTITKRYLSREAVPQFVNIFHATQQLLLRKVPPHWWAAGAETRDVDLLREHAPRYVAKVEDLAGLYDHLCVADLLSPTRFECHATLFPCRAFIAAAATHWFSNARDVGALVPPAALPSHAARRPAPDTQEAPGVHRPMTRSEWLDAKVLLRDSESQRDA